MAPTRDLHWELPGQRLPGTMRLRGTQKVTTNREETVLTCRNEPADELGERPADNLRGGRMRRSRLLTWENSRVELRGFEPLTFCMPCTANSSDGVACGLVSAGQARYGV